jgi:hypothetical protein
MPLSGTARIDEVPSSDHAKARNLFRRGANNVPTTSPFSWFFDSAEVSTMSTADYDVGVEKTAAEDRPICGLATLSMIFGILSFVILPVCGALVALVLGWSSLSRIRESAGHLGGETRARIGIGLGILNLAFCFLALLFVLTSVRSYRMEATPEIMQATSAPMPPPVFSPLTAGVKMANEMGRSEYELIEKLHLADQDEPVVCTYTASGDSFNPEMAVLTNQRISYVKDGRITPLKLTEIASILDHRKYMERYQPQSGGFNPADQFNIEIIGKDGTRMRVVIRPALDGPSFYEALNDSWKAAGGGETATTDAKPQ